MSAAVDPIAELERGFALQRQGRLREADAVYGALYQRHAGNPQILNTLGALAARAGAMQLALTYLAPAAAMASRNPSVLANFGSALISIHNLDVAIDNLERAVAIDPEFQPGWYNLARALNAAGDAERALETAQHLKAKNPGHLGARMQLILALTHLGRFEAAESEALEIIARWPDSARGFVAIAPVRRFAPGDPILAQAQRLLDQGRCPPNETGDLNFALGKMYDDAGRPEGAFRAFGVANARNAPPYNRKDIEDRFDTIARTYSSELIKKRRDQGHRSNVPILVVGMPRSGTTLIERILTAHPDVGSVGEAHFLRGIALSIDGFTPREGDFESMLRGLSADALEFLGHRYVEKLQQQVSDRSKTRIVDKMPHNFINLGFAALTLPDVKILHVRRAPIATCLSCWMQNFNQSHEYAAQFDDLAHHYAQYRRLMAHWSRAIGDRILDVFYEDVVRNPEAEALRILDWLGLSAAHYSLGDEQAPKVVTTASAWQVRQPVHQDSIDRWRAYEQYLTPLKLALLDHGIDPETP